MTSIESDERDRLLALAEKWLRRAAGKFADAESERLDSGKRLI